MDGTWDLGRVAAVAASGSVGAGLRWAVVSSIEPGRFPWPVFAVNVAGSVLLGALLAAERSNSPGRIVLHDFGAIGFCGGLTTFSTFSLEVVDLAQHGDVAMAAAYTVASVAAGIVGIIAGAGALRRVRAVSLPVEEKP